jgi:hypothetical protein
MPFLAGSMRFMATSACSYGYTNGRLRGELVLRDPVSGTVRIFGTRAAIGTLNRDDGRC